MQNGILWFILLILIVIIIIIAVNSTDTGQKTLNPIIQATKESINEAISGLQDDDSNNTNEIVKGGVDNPACNIPNLCNSCHKCECKCTTKTFDFCVNPGYEYTKLHCTELFSIPDVATIIAHGFGSKCKPEALSSVCCKPIEPCPIDCNDNQCDRNNGSNCKKKKKCANMGLGIDENCNHLLDSKHFIQFDVLDIAKFYNNDCENPTITICHLKSGEGFEIGFSNTLGEFGYLEYTYTQGQTNSCEDSCVTINLFDPNLTTKPRLTQFISVRAKTGEVLINNITIQPCK